MKNLLCISALALTLFGCGNANNEHGNRVSAVLKNNPILDSASFTTVEWIGGVEKDLGKLKKGQTAEITYVFKNTGSKPLVIESVSPGCGCTVAQKPEKPILPGGEDKIVAQFNTKDQSPGTHEKTITVRSNTRPSTDYLLHFSAVVEE